MWNVAYLGSSLYRFYIPNSHTNFHFTLSSKNILTIDTKAKIFKKLKKASTVKLTIFPIDLEIAPHFTTHNRLLQNWLLWMSHSNEKRQIRGKKWVQVLCCFARLRKVITFPEKYYENCNNTEQITYIYKLPTHILNTCFNYNNIPNYT